MIHVPIARLLDQNPDRVFQQALERLEEGCTYSSVNRPVIARHGHLHHVARNELAILYDGSFLNPANGKDTGIRRIDNGRKLLNTKHSEVGDCKGATLPVRGLQFLVVCLLSKILYLRSNMRKGFTVGRADDRN